MALVLVTGASGAGKSTVARELRRRGYQALDTDEDRLSSWVENATGAEVSAPGEVSDEWFGRHTLRLPPGTVLRISGEVGDHLGFICGTTGNEGEVWELFDAVVSLSVDVQALRERLASRGGFGSSVAEQQRILRWQNNIDTVNAGFGALIVDANGPVEQVVNQLLEDLVARLGSLG